MNNFNLNKPNLNKKVKAFIVSFILLVLIGLAYQALKKVNDFFEDNHLQFNRIINIELKKPIEIRKNEMISPIVKYIELIDYPDEIDTPIEKYICEKFGQFECKTALAIAKAESGLKEDAININTNDTIDIGIFQINSVHFKKDECQLKDIVIAEKNVDCAYMIFEAQGWTPWVAYQNGAFKSKL